MAFGSMCSYFNGPKMRDSIIVARMTKHTSDYMWYECILGHHSCDFFLCRTLISLLFWECVLILHMGWNTWPPASLCTEIWQQETACKAVGITAYRTTFTIHILNTNCLTSHSLDSKIFQVCR